MGPDMIAVVLGVVADHLSVARFVFRLAKAAAVDASRPDQQQPYWNATLLEQKLY